MQTMTQSRTRPFAGAAVNGQLLKARAPHISPGIVTLPDERLGFGRGILVRDPDGHVMEVVKR